MKNKSAFEEWLNKWFFDEYAYNLGALVSKYNHIKKLSSVSHARRHIGHIGTVIRKSDRAKFNRMYELYKNNANHKYLLQELRNGRH